MDSVIAISGVVLGGFIFYLVVKLVVRIFRIIAEWKIFSKAGEKGWKTFIPFVNTYTEYKITWKKSLYWLYLIVSLLYYISLGWLRSYFLSSAGGDPTQQTIANVLLIVLIVAGIVMAVMDIIVLAKLSKAFGHGFGYTLGLIFLRPIFIMILGFGKDEYVGGDNWPEVIETAV